MGDQHYDRSVFAQARAVMRPQAQELSCPPPTLRPQQLLKRQVLTLGLALAVLGYFATKAGTLDITAIFTQVGAIKPTAWVLALWFGALSFWAVGRYDEAIHGMLDTGIAPKEARRAGMSAIAIGQFVGFGAFTGSLVRWRMLPTLSLWQAFRVSMTVTLSFLSALALLLAVVIVLTGTPFVVAQVFAGVVIAVALSALIYALLPLPSLSARKGPSLRHCGRIFALVVLDTGFAALALFALTPPEVTAQLFEAFCAFLIALGAGIIGATPGGVGPFEAAFTGLMPDVAIEPLLASIFAFRIAYYLVPAGIGALVLISSRFQSRPAPRHPTSIMAVDLRKPSHHRLIANAYCAEAQLANAGDFNLLSIDNDRSGTLVAALPESLVMMGAPLAGNTPQACAQLKRAARRRGLGAFVYKIGARDAVALRRLGWQVHAISQNAILSPASFTCEGARKRQLRRVLRKARDAGVQTQHVAKLTDALLDEMRDVARDWSKARGGERGFSCGRFDRATLTRQRIYTARVDGKLLAFVSFNENRHERALDLIRHVDDMPNGVIHALIVNAIEDARADDVARLSLAAVPLMGDQLPNTLPRPFNGWLHSLANRSYARAGSQGLRRFKASFDPRWEPLYVAAPTRKDLVIGGYDIARRLSVSHPFET